MKVGKIRLRLVSFPLLFLFIATNSISGAQFANSDSEKSATPKKYLIDWVAIKTPIGTSTLDSATADKFTQEVVYAFNEASSGLIQFEKGQFLGLLNSPKPIMDVREFIELLGDRARKTPSGYERIITIGITTKQDKNPYGQAISGGSFTVLWIEPHSYLLFHEMAHNFKAGHAHSIECEGIPGTQKCQMVYMGDYSDVTGAYKLATSLNQPLFRVNGVFLHEMGLIKENQISYADGDLETWIKPIYPVATAGTKIVYLPLQGSAEAYAIEYRAPIGQEDGLRLERVPYKNFGTTLANVPSHGLQIRLLGSGYRKDTPSFPTIESDYSSLEAGDTAILVNPGSKRQGLDPGSSIVLNDGTTINFLNYDSTNGARVKITRTPDKEAPKIELNNMGVYGRWFVSGDSRILQKNSSGNYDWPNLRLFFSKLSDNRRIAKLELLLNGELYKTLEPPYRDNAAIDTSIEMMGDHEMVLRATDAAGNKSEIMERLSYKPYVLPKPFISVEPGKNDMKIKVYGHIPGLGVENRISFKVTNLSSGQVTKSEPIENDGVQFLVEGITRNSKLEFTVESQDTFGNVGSSHTLTREVLRSTCSKARCYVGAIFNYSDRSWKYPIPVLKLQQLINNKWLTVATATPIKGAKSDSRYSFQLENSFKVAGTYTMRITHDSFTYKGKSYAGYASQPFKQIIEP